MTQAIVLLPGLLCDHRLWAAQLPALEARGDVLVGDLTRAGSVGALAEQMLAAAPARFALAGLSMGGYGALRLAFTYPERYAGAASLSGADLPALEKRPERKEVVDNVFGGPVPDEVKLENLLDQVDASSVPPLYIGCGTDEDRLIGPNRGLAKRAAELGIDVTTDFRPGEHEWGLWDATLPDVIAWLTRLRTAD